MNTNYNYNFIYPYIFIFLFVYLCNSILFLNLPKKTLYVSENKTKDIKYSAYNSFFGKQKILEKKRKKRADSKDYLSIDKILLKAIYIQNDNSGWVILQEKNSNKTSIIEQNEYYNSYKLKKLYKSYIILEKNEKEYKLALKDDLTKLNYTINSNKNVKIEVSGDDVKISRTYLNSYINDLSKVWENISIKEIRVNGKIDGFKVLKVKKDSVFDKLGLKQFDVIKRVNNQVLTSYNEAFAIYKNIDKTDFFLIEVLRNNEILELSYEIN